VKSNILLLIIHHPCDKPIQIAAGGKKVRGAASALAVGRSDLSWLFGSSSHKLAQMCTAHLPFAKKKERKK